MLYEIRGYAFWLDQSELRDGQNLDGWVDGRNKNDIHLAYGGIWLFLRGAVALYFAFLLGPAPNIVTIEINVSVDFRDNQSDPI